MANLKMVNVSREMLLAKLKVNRDKHVKEYDEAVLGYKVDATERLNKAVADAKRKVDEVSEHVRLAIDRFDPDEKRLDDVMVIVPQHLMSLKVPRNHVADYDTAIDMLTWETRETIELPHQEFQCLVRDEWDWSQEFRTTAMSFSNYKKGD